MQLRENLDYSGKGKKSLQLNALTLWILFFIFFIHEICTIYVLVSQNQLDLLGLNFSIQSMCNLKGRTTETPNSSSEILLKVSWVVLQHQNS